MTISLIVRPEAEADIVEAYAWYERQRDGLGNEFLLRVEAALESIRFNAALNPPIFKEIRRKLLRRFPYGVFYISTTKHISVLAVQYGKRHPRYWQGRANK